MLSNSSRQYMNLVQTNSRETSNGVTLADDNMPWVMLRDIYCIKENANRVIRSLWEWAKETDLKFSAHKTKAIVFIRKRLENLYDLMLNGNIPEYVKKAKVLGCVIELQNGL